MARRSPLPDHGTPARYGKYGCRCARCRKENTERAKRYRATGSTLKTPPNTTARQRALAQIGKPSQSNVVSIDSRTKRVDQVVTPAEPDPPTEPGPNERAWLAQVELSSKAEELPSVVAIGQTLSRQLDDPEFAESYPTISRQLQALRAELREREQRKRKGSKLATVTRMSSSTRNTKGRASG